ncbi:putative ankyrin repeat protein RF_0381 [Microplitis mediator]|uniref:putative ankyrin repeat protein RF_0381 n=1 Tax=Microplitis mediator TaxID=375433 RepID=UPI002556E843|nr:putative ankyrin repeat protein RF_0381 [Microplitis mediator]XP_057330067.1 putative ankyrin repeat protein RF_0381 [Microplitis mediator]
MADENLSANKRKLFDANEENESSPSKKNLSESQDNLPSSSKSTSVEACDDEDFDIYSGNYDFYSINDKYGDHFPLHTAVEKNDWPAFMELLRIGIDIDAPRLDGDTALHIAVKTNNLDMIDCLLKYGANVYARTIYNGKIGYTALHLAAELSPQNTFEHLLSIKPNFHISSHLMRKRVLHCALNRRSVKMIKYLFKDTDINSIEHKGVKALLLSEEESTINPVTELNETPLFLAVKRGYIDLVKMILENGGNVYSHGNYVKYELCSVFHVAADINREDIMILLKNHGIIVNTITEYGLNALHIAVLNSNLPLAKTLIDWGIEVNQKGNVNSVNTRVTPLHIAVKNRNFILIELLITNKSIDVNATDGTHKSALYMAVEAERLDLIEFLLTRSTNIDIHMLNTKNGCTVLHRALELNNKNMVDLLLKYGANHDVLSIHGMHSIHVAADNGNLIAVENFLNSGIDVDLPVVAFGLRPLHIAVGNRSVPLVKLLLKKGADVDAFTVEGNPPLQFAVMFNNKKMTEILLKFGADINLVRKFPDQFDNIDQILKEHFIKLETANMYMNKESWFYCYYSNLVKKGKDFSKKSSRYAKEITRMKKAVIQNTTVNYNDYLIKSDNELASYARNRDVVNGFTQNQVIIKFPLYSKIIIKRFNKSLEHCKLFNHAEKFLTNLFCEFLPVTFLRNILEYLSIDDLKPFEN